MAGPGRGCGVARGEGRATGPFSAFSVLSLIHVKARVVTLPLRFATERGANEIIHRKANKKRLIGGPNGLPEFGIH